jgi:hypothetical protein
LRSWSHQSLINLQEKLLWVTERVLKSEKKPQQKQSISGKQTNDPEIRKIAANQYPRQNIALSSERHSWFQVLISLKSRFWDKSYWSWIYERLGRINVCQTTFRETQRYATAMVLNAVIESV